MKRKCAVYGDSCNGGCAIKHVVHKEVPSECPNCGGTTEEPGFYCNRCMKHETQRERYEGYGEE